LLLTNACNEANALCFSKSSINTCNAIGAVNIPAANLQAFVSNNAQTIYGYNPPYKEVMLEKKPFAVTHAYGDVVPMFANETLAWSIGRVL
jgi:dihydroorotase